MSDPIMTRNSLTFSQTQDGGFICRELGSIPQTFSQIWSPDEISSALEEYFDLLRKDIEKRYPDKASHDAVPESERKRLGREIFDRIRASISTDGMNPFQSFVFWLTNWWFYHYDLRTQAVIGRDDATYEAVHKLMARFIVPALPEQVRQTIGRMQLVSVAINGAHFAFLFQDNSDTRRIVTDTQLIELHDVFGYNYLDILEDGRPVARSRTNRGGGRAFFDGVRLMSHERFQTCAPKTVPLNRGYMVNSTHVTIINGHLFNLVDDRDEVAHTTGQNEHPWFGGNSFTNAQQFESFRLAEANKRRTQVAADGTFSFDGAPLTPRGTFLPSEVTLLDSGFSRYEWSTFVKNQISRYRNVLVVDDLQTWIDKVAEAFGSKVTNLTSFCTTSGNAALERILQDAPDVVLLDMHLSADERFEGLWIANQLAARGFKGKILITSGYPREALEAMAKLIKTGVSIPGKSISNIAKLLFED